MNGIGPFQANTVSSPGNEDARIRQVARQMEGVFVEQLFKAMRETVPEGGIFDGGAGEEIFTGMMDQHMASQVPDQWDSSLSRALYRQLRGAAGLGDAPPTTPAGGQI